MAKKKPRRKRQPPAIDRLHDLHRRFADAHRLGIDALRRRDYEALGNAIALERGLILEHAALIERQRAKFLGKTGGLS